LQVLLVLQEELQSPVARRAAGRQNARVCLHKLLQVGRSDRW